MQGWGRKAALGIAVALVVLAPLPFGAVGATARALLALAVAAGLSLLWIDRRGLAFPPAFLGGLTLATLLLAGAFLVPLPPAAVAVLSPRLAREAALSLASPAADPALAGAERALAAAAGAPRYEARWRPLAADPDGALEGTTRLVLALGAFVLALVAAGNAREGRRALAAALGVSAFVQAAYGLAESLSGSHRIWGWVNPYYDGLACGTFVCPNHFAAVLSLGLFAMLGLLATRPREFGGLADSAVDARLSRGARVAVLATAAALAAIAMLWSSSRAALGAAALGLAALAGGLAVTRELRGPGARVLLGAAALLVAVVGGAVLMRPVDPLVTDIEQTSAGLVDREHIWHLASTIVQAFPVTGSGPGTFDAVHRLFRPPELSVVVAHAHSDWLEWRAETGLPGLALLAAWMLALVAGTVRLVRGGSERALTIALAAGLLALGVHEIFDFSLQLPGVAVPAAIAAGALLAPLPWRPSASRRGTPRPRLWPAVAAVVTVAAAACGLATLVYDRDLPAGEPPSFAGVGQLVDWSRSEVDSVLRVAKSQPAVPVTPEQVRRVDAAYRAAQEAAWRAPFRGEARIACWVAAQAVAFAHQPRPLPGGFLPLSEYYLDRAVALDPANRGRRFQVARLRIAAGNVPGAQREIHALLEMDSRWAAKSYEMLGGAKLELADLMAATPNRPEAAVALAEYLSDKRSDLPGAQLVLDRALARHPDDAPLRRTAAGVRFARGNAAGALEVLDGRPLPADPIEHRYALEVRAQVLLTLKRFDRLDDDLTALARAGEDPRRIAAYQAAAKSEAGDHARAIALLSGALEPRGTPMPDRQRLELLIALGREQTAAGLHRDALETYRKAEAIDPDQPEVRSFLARLDPGTSQ